MRLSRIKVGDYVYMKRGKLKGEVVHLIPEQEKAMVKISLGRNWPKAYGYGKTTSSFMEIWPVAELSLRCELTECLYD